MSWFSNIGHAVANIFAAKADPATPVIENPKTPVEIALNNVAMTAENDASPVLAAIKTEAEATVTTYLNTAIGAVGGGVTLSALQALATTALHKMDTSGNATEEAVAEKVETLLNDLGIATTLPATTA